MTRIVYQPGPKPRRARRWWVINLPETRSIDRRITEEQKERFCFLYLYFHGPNHESCVGLETQRRRGEVWFIIVKRDLLLPVGSLYSEFPDVGKK